MLSYYHSNNKNRIDGSGSIIIFINSVVLSNRLIRGLIFVLLPLLATAALGTETHSPTRLTTTSSTTFSHQVIETGVMFQYPIRSSSSQLCFISKNSFRDVSTKSICRTQRRQSQNKEGRILASCYHSRTVHSNNNNHQYSLDVQQPPYSSRLYGSFTGVSESLIQRPMIESRSKTILRSPKASSLFYQQQKATTRLFGCKPGDGNPSGDIYIENDQSDLPNIDLDKLKVTISKIRKFMGYDTYDVSIFLINDKEMKRTNNESRGINHPTDILSFPFHPPTSKPGIIEAPKFDIPDYYQLGDILIDVPYVIRRCIEDKEYAMNEDTDGSDDDEDGDDDGFVEDYDESGDGSGGVSGAMSTVYDPEKRIHMLLIHGMLHLVGHDHENDHDYDVMMNAEEKILRELNFIEQDNVDK